MGHVHEPAVLHTDPWVVFPGNLQGRHIRETGARGALLVTADDNRIVSVERLSTDVLRWHRLAVDVSAADDLASAVRIVGREFSLLFDTAHTGHSMAVRLVLTGRSAAHGDLFGSEAQLRAEILALSASLAGDRAWIEKVCVETIPALDAATVRARSDAIADLQSLLDGAPTDPALLSSLTDELRLLADRTPHELNSALPQLQAIRNGEVGPIIESVVPGLIAHLIKAG